MPDEQPLISDVTGLAKLADSKLANKVYDDVLVGAARQAGMAVEDFVKAFRLVLTPIRLMSIASDRMEALLRDAESRVPPERQQEAAPEVAIPILRDVVCTSDDSPLRAMYLELLTRAIDREYCGEAHPAFAKIIGQLSPDEARLLLVLRESRGAGWRRLDPEIVLDVGDGVRFYEPKPIEPKYRLVLGDDYLRRIPPLHHPELLFDHLFGLGILRWTRSKARPERDSVYGEPLVPFDSAFTEFGRSFIEACLPDSFAPEE